MLEMDDSWLLVDPGANISLMHKSTVVRSSYYVNEDTNIVIHGLTETIAGH